MGKAVKREKWNRTGSEMADMFGVSAVTLSGWVKDGAPKIARDQYDERAFVPWVLDQYRRKDTATLAEEQARLTKNKADLAEIELAEKRGEVVRVSDVQEEYGRVVSAVRGRLLSLSASVTPQIQEADGPVEIGKILDDAIRSALNELGNADFSKEPRGGDRKAKSKTQRPRKTKAKRGHRR